MTQCSSTEDETVSGNTTQKHIASWFPRAALQSCTILPPARRPTCVPGFFPPVDDEYIEYADALVVEHDPALPYVVVEIGARYGTWAVRCIKALQHLHPHAKYVAYLLESEEKSAERCREHCAHNNVDCHVVVDYAGTGEDPASDFSASLPSIKYYLFLHTYVHASRPSAASRRPRPLCRISGASCGLRRRNGSGGQRLFQRRRCNIVVSCLERLSSKGRRHHGYARREQRRLYLQHATHHSCAVLPQAQFNPRSTI